MIFDGKLVTEQVTQWQTSKDQDLLEVILENSRSLVEALVSQYDPYYRDDLIQESFLKIVRALPVFDCKLGTLHTYLTTVIKNACITWLTKYDKDDFNLGDTDDDLIGNSPTVPYSPDLLQDIIIRNRERFPSLPVDVVDELTETIYSYLCEGRGVRVLLRSLVDNVQVPRSIAQTVYQSTLIYLRSRFITYSKDVTVDEFSLAKELMDVLGTKNAKLLLSTFAGMTLKLP